MVEIMIFSVFFDRKFIFRTEKNLYSLSASSDISHDDFFRLIIFDVSTRFKSISIEVTFHPCVKMVMIV